MAAKTNAKPKRAPTPAEQAATKIEAENTPDLVIMIVSDNPLIKGEHPVFYTEISDREVSEVRRQTGKQMNAILDELIYTPDIDVVKALVWVSLRQDRLPAVEWDQVRVTYADKVKLDFTPGGRDDPKA